MSSSASILLTWEAALGESLLRFILNRDEGSLTEKLTPAQEEVLASLESGGRIGPWGDPRYPVALAGVSDGEPSTAWQFRAKCGGSVPEPCGDDELERALTLIARDSYPVLLSRTDLTVQIAPGRSVAASSPSIGLSQLVTAHPAHHIASRELAEEGEGWRDVFVESVLARDPLGGVPTPEMLIGAAAERWQHRPGADAGDLLGDVLETLVAFRDLAAGRPVDSVAVIGLRGLDLERELEYELPIGLIRAPTDHEVRYAPFMQGPTEVDAVLVVPTILTPTESGVSVDGEAGGLEKIVKLTRTVSLASALAERLLRGNVEAIAICWITEWTPMQGSGAFKPGPKESFVPKAHYGEAELDRLSGWIERIQAADISHISIAIDRILRAIFEFESAESLIDAVIAWENLVGSRIETVYKVTASITVLCEDDPLKRVAFRKSIDKLYEERSRLVHGDKEGTEISVRNEAIHIGLETIARLIERRPDLLELSKSSKRADRLLLGIES